MGAIPFVTQLWGGCHPKGPIEYQREGTQITLNLFACATDVEHMSTWSFVKSERIALKNHPQIQDSWVYDCIAGEPGILGLGDLTLNTRGRGDGGRQELVFGCPGSDARYACVVQTGATDETQIIQAIECWDQERTRQAGGDLRALIVAEQITPRFLSVMSVLGSTVPFTAVQMQAMKVGTQMTLIFNTVTGGDTLAVVESVVESAGNQQEYAEQSQTAAPVETAAVATEPESQTAEPETYLASVELGATVLSPISELAPEEEPIPAAIDRSFWADQFLSIAQSVDPAFELDYRPEYIGLARDGQSLDFARFTPEATGILLGLSLEPNSLTELSIAQAGFERLSSESNGYGIRLSKQDIEAQREPVTRLLQLAYDESKG